MWMEMAIFIQFEQVDWQIVVYKRNTIIFSYTHQDEIERVYKTINNVCKRLEPELTYWHVLMDTNKRKIMDRVKDLALQWATNDHFQQIVAY